MQIFHSEGKEPRQVCQLGWHQAPRCSRENCFTFQDPYTPLKINMEPENEGLEDEFPFQTGDFQVPC